MCREAPAAVLRKHRPEAEVVFGESEPIEGGKYGCLENRADLPCFGGFRAAVWNRGGSEIL